MTGVRLRGTLNINALSAFTESNVRTHSSL